MKVEALSLAGLVFSTRRGGQPTDPGFVDSLAPHVFAAAGDKYYKVAAEALRACRALVPVVASDARSHAAALAEAALSRGDVDLLVGNPDISAPLGGAFSAEPGYWALRAMQATGVRPYWYGKPYQDAFDLVLARLESTQGRSFDRRRVAMVGDSLHTDILGARAAGLQAVLLTGYGLFSDGGALRVE